MRKRLRKKVTCPKCGNRPMRWELKLGLCWHCERIQHKATQELFNELADQIPWLGAIRSSGWWSGPRHRGGF